MHTVWMVSVYPEFADNGDQREIVLFETRQKAIDYCLQHGFRGASNRDEDGAEASFYMGHETLRYAWATVCERTVF